jgi:hypothetical protein
MLRAMRRSPSTAELYRGSSGGWFLTRKGGYVCLFAARGLRLTEVIMKRLLLGVSICFGLCVLPVFAADKPAPVGQGDTCGGFMNVPCEEGLECRLSPPGSTAGECVPASGPIAPGKNAGGPGDMCGGIAAIPCQKGLRCNLTSKNIDASGVCESPH